MYFTVPNGHGDPSGIDANDATDLPFTTPSGGGARYQQVFDSAAFGAIPSGGAFLVMMAIQADCANVFQQEWTLTNLDIWFSTTHAKPDGLSPVFDQNTGSDRVLVSHSDQNFVEGYSYRACPRASGEALGLTGVLEFANPFWYVPTNGNLLVEIRFTGMRMYRSCLPQYKDCAGLPLPRLDAQTELGDSISRIVGLSPESTTADVVDTTGLVMYFEFAPSPRLSISNAPNGIAVTWPYFPKGLRLQATRNLRSLTQWTDVVGTPSQVGLFLTLTLPRSSSATPTFYRVYLPPVPTAPPPPAEAAPPAVPSDNPQPPTANVTP
ncbi:MAG TPA: hypothetical protein DCM86_05820 [Verrucomicrobiales bacterium]|nr:hypothetical protein [Verrucomicrobiales bacterium]